MTYYNAEPTPPETPVDLPEPWDAEKTVYSNEDRERDMRYYKPDQGLQDAVNTALLLRRPLLLTGESGTGKTELASHLAWKLGWGRALRFDTKSTSTARDLFYSYDALGHFRAVQLQAAQVKTVDAASLPAIQASDYITLNPLGLAILLSLEKAELQRRGLYTLFQKSLQEQSIHYDAPRCSVVLIDEIDKAPRDFPNDILNELETLSFRLPELREAQDMTPIRATPKLRPVVVITSNSEKHLPDPFLRRCVYYNIPFPLDEPNPSQPQAQLMKDIINHYAQNDAMLGVVFGHHAFLNDALSLFYALRQPDALRKKPSTAELLAWLYRLRHEFKVELEQRQAFVNADYPLAATFSDMETRQRISKDLGLLLKVKEDLTDTMPKLLSRWTQARLASEKS